MTLDRQNQRAVSLSTRQQLKPHTKQGEYYE